MGSLGYAKCHWCKTEGWNFYIPDGVGGPLCEKCLWDDNYWEFEENSSDQESEELAPELEPELEPDGTDVNMPDGNVAQM